MSAHAIITKTKLKQKFFSQISDHQQSVVPVPSRGQPHTPSSALLVVADLTLKISQIAKDSYGISIKVRSR